MANSEAVRVGGGKNEKEMIRKKKHKINRYEQKQQHKGNNCINWILVGGGCATEIS